MNTNRIVALITVVGLGFSSSAMAAEPDATDTTRTSPARISAQVPHAKRGMVLPALYGMLGAMQVWDVYSTSTALNAGAKERNPAAAVFAENTGQLIGLKMATTASTIFFAERMWKKNKAAAIIMMVAINGATAAVSLHNVHNATIARRR